MLEHAGDFFVPVSFDIVQHQNLSRAIGKPLDRGFDIEREPGRQVASRQPIERFRIVGVTLPFDPQRLASGQDQVQSKAVQPGAECRIAAKCAELLPGPDEDLLRHILRIVADHPPHEGVNPSQMAAVQPLEGMRVSGRGQGGIHGISVNGVALGGSAQRHSSGLGDLHAGIWTGNPRQWLEKCLQIPLVARSTPVGLNSVR